jgi:hypothetical protein
MAICPPNEAINRILAALGLENVRSLKISAEVNSVVTVVTEQYVTGNQMDDLAAALETKEWVLVPKDASRWVPVSERLPEEGERVLYYNGDCQQDYARNVRIGRCIDDGPTGTRELRIVDMELDSLTPNRDKTWPDVTPTHWMPLPAY